MSVSPNAATLVDSAVRLRGVFEHKQFVAFRDIHQGAKVGGLAVEMYRDDALGPWGNSSRHL